MIKVNPEDFTDSSAENLTYTELEMLNIFDFLYDLDKQDIISLLLSILADADNQYELVEYLVNWNKNNE